MASCLARCQYRRKNGVVGFSSQKHLAADDVVGFGAVAEDEAAGGVQAVTTAGEGGVAVAEDGYAFAI